MPFRILRDRQYAASLPSTAFRRPSEVAEIGASSRWCRFVYDFIPAHELRQAGGKVPSSIVSGGRPLLASAVALSGDGRSVLKIEFFPHFRKRNSLIQEIAIVKALNDAGCVSAPRIVESGSYTFEEMRDAIPCNIQTYLDAQGRERFEYMIMDFVPSGRRAPLSDILLAMLEQKSLGVYHGDVKPANIRYDEEKGICVLIDYDQAEVLPPHVVAMSATDFLDWCDVREKERYDGKFYTWCRHFKGLNYRRHVSPMLRNGAFNLAFTTPYRRQVTTNTKDGVYHTIVSPIIYADGVRDLRDREALLDQVEFTHNETVLDIGCNAGLLCHYLAARGCIPTGIEMDGSIVFAARMIANILGISAKFVALDIDSAEIPGKFDTVCLFSVIHHTRNLKENGRKIAQSCKRILIECRLSERGRKPVKDWLGRVKWVATSVWDYSDETELAKGLAELFPGFLVARNVGYADKNRMLLELSKK